jgi:putative FmdB family regulatory protein
MTLFRHFDFKCDSCKSIFEEMIAGDESELPCPSCGGKAHRQLSAPRIDWRRMGVDPGFPGAYSKWGKAITQHHKHGKDSLRDGKGTSLLMH